MTTTNVMIDLETLGTRPGCVILSIGMVLFDAEGILPGTFYKVINTASCLAAGLTVDDQTRRWWDQQSAAARGVLYEAEDPGQTPLGRVLVMADDWLLQNGSPNVWGNGADFDLTILSAAYHVCGLGTPPWQPWSGRCYRTLKNLRPDIKVGKRTTHHNALDDALVQAEHASRLFKALNFGG